MPDVLVKFSWEAELIDVDGDWDLDAAVSCKQCAGSYLFENDGSGLFTDVTSGRMPQFANNYEFEPMDVDNDEDLDLVTINDGSGPPLSEHLLLNDGHGSFSDETRERWPASENIGMDDNMVAFLDVESDGDADFVIGSLDGDDRLLMNDGNGMFSLRTGIIDATTPSGGTLGIAIADLDQDGQLDIVEAQGEVPGQENERVYVGTRIEQDAAPPVVAPADPVVTAAGVLVRARVHDRISPSRPFQFSKVVVQTPAGDELPMRWYGEYLWAATVPADSGDAWVVCAVDAAGLESCSDEVAAPA